LAAKLRYAPIGDRTRIRLWGSGHCLLQLLHVELEQSGEPPAGPEPGMRVYIGRRSVGVARELALEGTAAAIGVRADVADVGRPVVDLDSRAKCNRALREPYLHVFAKLFEDCLKRSLEAQAFSGREIGGDDDVLDFLVGHFVDVDLTRQPAS
jgi:hypothetical protein